MTNISQNTKLLWQIILRELHILCSPIYIFSMIIFPLFCAIFFTTLMGQGLPNDIPTGVVDCDNTPNSRAIIREIDSYQECAIVGRYNNVNDARRAIQQGKIYGFYYIPPRFTEDLLTNLQPKVSYYTNNGVLMAGSLLYMDMRTASTVAVAGMAERNLAAHGFSKQVAEAFMQPVRTDIHALSNPAMNYNIYLSNTLIPGMLMLFIMLITTYSIGCELKFNRARELMHSAGGNIHIALLGKLIPQGVVWFGIDFICKVYLYQILGFPHFCPFWQIAMTGALTVLSAQGLAVFFFGLAPSLRFSMSLCCLWGVVSFSICGFAFPVPSMHPMIQAMSYLFPLRSVFMIYQMLILNGYPLIYEWLYIGVLCLFALLPLFMLPHIRTVLTKYVYIP
jgi:ABC-2 type transport system permease protein